MNEPVLSLSVNNVNEKVVTGQLEQYLTSYSYHGPSAVPFLHIDRDVFDYTDKCICSLDGIRFQKRHLTERQTMSDLVGSGGYSDGGTLRAVQLLRTVKSEPLVKI